MTSKKAICLTISGALLGTSLWACSGGTPANTPSPTPSSSTPASSATPAPGETSSPQAGSQTLVINKQAISLSGSPTAKGVINPFAGMTRIKISSPAAAGGKGSGQFEVEIYSKDNKALEPGFAVDRVLFRGSASYEDPEKGNRGYDLFINTSKIIEKKLDTSNGRIKASFKLTSLYAGRNLGAENIPEPIELNFDVPFPTP